VLLAVLSGLVNMDHCGEVVNSSQSKPATFRLFVNHATAEIFPEALAAARAIITEFTLVEL